MAAITQLSPIALPGKRRTFEAKTEAAPVISTRIRRGLLLGVYGVILKLKGIT